MYLIQGCSGFMQDLVGHNIFHMFKDLEKKKKKVVLAVAFSMHVAMEVLNF